MPDTYLTLAEVAERAGLTAESAREYHKRATRRRRDGKPWPLDLPAPDLTLGRVPGWKAATVQTWIEARAERAEVDARMKRS